MVGRAYHLIIHAFLLQQLLMVALLEHFAATSDDYDCFLLASARGRHGEQRRTVSILDSRQPMGHGNDGPSLFASGSLNRLLHQLFRLRVQTGCRFIKKEKPGFPQEGPRKGKSLTLTSAELHRLRSKLRRIPFRQRHNEIVDLRLSASSSTASSVASASPTLRLTFSLTVPS